MESLPVGEVRLSAPSKAQWQPPTEPSSRGGSETERTTTGTMANSSRGSKLKPPTAAPRGSSTLEKSGEDRNTISVSLPFRVVKGEIPPEMLERMLRDFTEEETEHIMAHCNRDMAPSCENPAALFVLGPSAVGKSYVTEATASQLFGSAHNAVVVDGEVFRSWHRGWCEVVLSGMKKHVLHQDAWGLFKNVKTKPAEDGSNGSNGSNSKEEGWSTWP